MLGLGVTAAMVVTARIWGEKRRRWRKERGEGGAGERERGEGIGKVHRLFFPDRKDYIAPLLMVP